MDHAHIKKQQIAQRYILEKLPEMDHTYIEEQQVAQRYILGKLPEADEERFEAHYFSCPECQDRLSVVRSMVRGFKRAATLDPVPLVVPSLAVVAWLARLGRARQWAALVLIPVLGLGSSGLLTFRLGEVSRQLAASHQVIAQKDRESSILKEQLAEAKSPQEVLNVLAVLSLAAERGAGAEKPSQELSLSKNPKDSGLIVLSLLIDEAGSSLYRVSLVDPGETRVWSTEGLQPDSEARLLIAFPSTRLAKPGIYRIAVEGSAGPVHRFQFSVAKPG